MSTDISSLRRLRHLVAAPLFLVASCRVDDSASPRDSSAAPSSSSVVSTTATTAAVTPPTTIAVQEDSSRCPIEALASDTVEPIISFVCVDGWATGLLADEECSNDCEGILVLRQEATGWRVVATCNQYSPLTPTSSQCFDRFTLDEVGSSDLPPLSVACELWEANRWDENLALTGCAA